MDPYRAEEIYKEAIELWGYDKQVDMWHEEVGELMQAINKYKRDPTPERLDHLYEEAIDVDILTGQIKSIIPEDRKQYWFNFKINRLELRIKAEKEKRLQHEESLLQLNPKYYAIFKMINEIGPNPLNSQMDDLINVVLEQHQIKKD